MQTSKRVAVNAGLLYGRILFTMFVTLFSTRLLLNGLGSRDYGIFNLIAGIIAMLSFLNAAMTTSTQRFLSINQGKGDTEMQKKVFSNSLLLHIIIAVIIVMALESTGVILFNGVLKIDANRIDTAKAVYHFMSATVFFTIIEAPFTGTLNAHENIYWLAIVGILETTFKLLLAAFIYYHASNDKLLVYGFVNPCIVMFSTILYGSFCLIKYKEASLKVWETADKKLMSQLASFAGWNLFGSLCVLGKTQGVAVILNFFFGTLINAAYGIANQISAQLNFLSATLLQVLNPQIMKSEGAGDTQRMLRLSMIASKFSFFLMAMVCIPLIFEMKSLLTLWLKTAPANTVIFCQLILVSVLVNQLTIGLQSSIQATGKIKNYQIVVGIVVLLNLPICYVILKMGLPPYLAIASFSLIEIIACCLRLYFTHQTSGLKVSTYFHRVLAREFIPTAICVIYCSLLVTQVNIPYRLIFTGLSSAAIFAVGIYYIGLLPEEKEIINKFFFLFLEKLKLRKRVTA